jgi:hypothetical protein
MSLRYPNARLFLHDLLFRERLSGAQALAAGACCFELLPAQAVSEILLAPVGDDCRCLDTAAVIVEQHLILRRTASDANSVDPKVVFAEIEKQARRAPDAKNNAVDQAASANTSTSTSSSSSSSSSSSTTAGGTSSLNTPLAGACHNHAPALFDIMLQELMRYS